MVGTYLPQSIFALHAIIASECIHDAMLQSMTYMQTARDIGRRNHNAVGVTFAGHVGGKITALFPDFIPFGFYILGGKCFFHCWAR